MVPRETTRALPRPPRRDRDDAGRRGGLAQAIRGAIALIACNASSVGHALAEIVRFIGYHSSGIVLDLDPPEGADFDVVVATARPSILDSAPAWVAGAERLDPT